MSYLGSHNIESYKKNQVAPPPENDLDAVDLDAPTTACEGVVDTRLSPGSLTPNETSVICKQALYQAAELHGDEYKVGKLRRLLRSEHRALATIQESSMVSDPKKAYEARKKHLSASTKQKKIKALLIEFEVAKMLLEEDWIIDRKEDISNNMGVISFEKLEEMILNFYHENGLLTDKNPLKKGKLIHLDAGCGNGGKCQKLRDSEVKPFDNGKRLVDYWTSLGFADYIYWTLHDLLQSLLKEEYREDPALQEFINVLSTLLIRRLGSLKQNYSNFKEIQTLFNLPYNPNLLRLILPNLDIYIEKLRNLKKIEIPSEFPGEKEFATLSPDCINLIDQYFNGPPDTSTSTKTKDNTLAFLEKYFERKAFDGNPDLENGSDDQILETNIELEQIEEEIDKLIMRKESLIESQSRTQKDEEKQVAIEKELLKIETNLITIISEKRKKKEQYRKLELNMDKPVNTGVDLKEEITIFPTDVVVGDFDQFDTIFPNSPIFNLIHASRSTSHLDNTQYFKTMQDIAVRMKPGAIFLDDGVKESYTRYERIDELIDLQKALGKEYKIGVITDEKGAIKSILIERFITLNTGETIFFSDKNREKLLTDTSEYTPLEEYTIKYPRKNFRNRVIRILKRSFIDITISDSMSARMRNEKLFQGRMKFKCIHDQLDALLNHEVFNSRHWQDIETAQTVNETTLYGVANQFMKRINRKYPIR